jgi:hypothetical protein
MEKQDFILMLSAAALMLLLAVFSRRRASLARARVERVKREVALEDLGGNSYFMPPPPMEQAVELDDAVEIDSLLSGESDTVAALARSQLERTTDIDISGGVRNLSFSLATPNPPAAPISAPLAQRHRDPIDAAPPSAPVPAPASDDIPAVPVRELVLAWFEARGYRPAALPHDSQPIELLLRHRATPERAYAFMVAGEGLTAQRVSSLFTLARSSGFKRLLIAASGTVDPSVVERVRPQGVKIFDEERIRAELGKIDIRIAAKIIAVARGRAATRRVAVARDPGRKDIAAAH